MKLEANWLFTDPWKKGLWIKLIVLLKYFPGGDWKTFQQHKVTIHKILLKWSWKTKLWKLTPIGWKISPSTSWLTSLAKFPSRSCKKQQKIISFYNYKIKQLWNTQDTGAIQTYSINLFYPGKVLLPLFTAYLPIFKNKWIKETYKLIANNVILLAVACFQSKLKDTQNWMCDLCGCAIVCTIK